MAKCVSVLYVCRRKSCDAFDVIICKIEMHCLFSVKKDSISLSFRSVKCHLTHKGCKSLVYVHFMFHFKVQVEVYGICFITSN